MKIRSRSYITFLLTLLVSTGVLFAFGNSRDKMKVTFSHPVHVQGDVLPAGTYTIETMSGLEANDNILEIYGKNNSKFRTNFMTIDARKMKGAHTTHITLLKIDGQYYLDKMFIQGHMNGYQVILPDNIRSQASSAESEDVSGDMSD